MKNLKTESPLNYGDLPPKLTEIYNLLRVNPTTNFIIKKTGYDRRNVSKLINRLIKRGYIRRIERGFYKVLKSPLSEQVVAVDRGTSDYFRYHNLQIAVRISQDDLRKLKNQIIKLDSYKEKHNGIYFKYITTGLLTKDKFYLYFPKDWDIVANTYDDLMSKVYENVLSNLKKWSDRFKIGIFKDNKVNFSICNQHIALVKNGIVKEFKGQKISEFVVYDDNDGKARFLMDFSKNLAELEAVHPIKANDDIQEAKYFMNTLKEGRYRSMYDKHNHFFDTDEKICISDLNKKMDSILNIINGLTKLQGNTSEELNTLTKLTAINVKVLEASIKKSSINYTSKYDLDYIN